jgi:hypothetical protein
MDSRLVPSFSEVLAASMGLGDMEIVGSASGGHQLIL